MKRISLLKTFVPTGYPLVAVVLAIIIAIAGIIISVLYGLAQPENFIRETLFPMGMFFFSFSALIIEIGAWIEKRAAPRLVLGCGAVFVMAMACGAVGIADLFMEEIEDPDTMLATTACCSLPVLLILAIPSFHALTRLQEEMQSARKEEREQLAIDMIGSKGIVTYTELGKALRCSEDEVDQILRTLMEEGKIQGVREVEHKRFYTKARFAEKKSQLLGMIAAQGEVQLESAAIELDAPVGLLKTWIYALVKDGKFTGYINWDKGVLYSADAETLREKERCPHCGGTLKMAGKGTVQCHHCHAEVFLLANQQE
ncbi:MAG: hypothetical protein JXB30_08320 [Anaerolineae bacterium]|nr:hypothetical protein [Anaerolineae bacterium]